MCTSLTKRKQLYTCTGLLFHKADAALKKILNSGHFQEVDLSQSFHLRWAMPAWDPQRDIIYIFIFIYIHLHTHTLRVVHCKTNGEIHRELFLLSISVHFSEAWVMVQAQELNSMSAVTGWIAPKRIGSTPGVGSRGALLLTESVLLSDEHFWIKPQSWIQPNLTTKNIKQIPYKNAV